MIDESILFIRRRNPAGEHPNVCVPCVFFPKTEKSFPGALSRRILTKFWRRRVWAKTSPLAPRKLLRSKKQPKKDIKDIIAINFIAKDSQFSGGAGDETGVAAVAALIFGFASAAVKAEETIKTQDKPATTASEADEGRYEALTREGLVMLAAKRFEDAISHSFDLVIARFDAMSAQSNKKLIYCSHGRMETLAYMTSDVANKNDAIAVSGFWCDAIYFKGFALISPGKIDDGEAYVRRALALAPMNATYLNELGHILSLRKNWPEALKLFEKAEQDAHSLRSRASESRACRGVGYVLIEQNLWQAAAEKYRQCLAIDPNDKVALSELEFIKRKRPQSQ